MRQILESVLNDVKKNGAKGDLVFQSSKSLKLSAHLKELSEYKVSGSQILGLRVIKDKKVGLSYTESTDGDSLKELVRQAIENASASSVNEFEDIQDVVGDVFDNDLKKSSEVDVDEKISKLTSQYEAFKKIDSRVESLPYNGYTENENLNYYMNTSGRFVERKDSFFQTWCMPLMSENGKKTTYYDYSVGKTYQEIDWDSLRSETVKHASALLKAVNLKTGIYQVHFTVDCLSELFGVFSSILSAKNVLNKMSAWEKSINTVVMNEDFSLIDDSMFVDAFSHYKTDGEGFDHKKTLLIDQGVLKTFLHNSATAKEMGTNNTFHAIRGPGSPLGVSSTNLILKAQKASHIDGDYIEILEMDGLHSGANTVTGDFSFSVRGYFHKGSEVIPFADATLSGNFYQMLKNMTATSTEVLANSNKSFFAPRIVFSDLSLAGQG